MNFHFLLLFYLCYKLYIIVNDAMLIVFVFVSEKSIQSLFDMCSCINKTWVKLNTQASVLWTCPFDYQQEERRLFIISINYMFLYSSLPFCNFPYSVLLFKCFSAKNHVSEQRCDSEFLWRKSLRCPAVGAMPCANCFLSCAYKLWQVFIINTSIITSLSHWREKPGWFTACAEICECVYGGSH